MAGSIHHRRQVARIAATLSAPHQPKRWNKQFRNEEVLGTEDVPSFEIKSFVPLSPQSSLATNQGWEYQENGYSYSNRPR